MFKDFVFKNKELSFRNSCFIFAAVTIFVYRYDRMTVSICIGCPLYRYCIDTECIVPALILVHARLGCEHYNICPQVKLEQGQPCRDNSTYLFWGITRI